MRGNDVRDLALSFPEAEERETWGHPTFRVRDKMFMGMAGDETTVTVKASKEAQAALVGSEPGTFFVPSYVGQHGWVGVRLEHVDAAELAELIEDAWRVRAPKRAVAAWDAAR